jgi:hypothetical protein
MNTSKNPLGLFALVLMAVAFQLALPAGAAAQEEPEGGDWKNVTLIYGTDIKGKIEPCG